MTRHICLERLCRKHKASFAYEETGMLISCTSISQYNIVLAMARKFKGLTIKTKTDFSWGFKGEISIEFK